MPDGETIETLMESFSSAFGLSGPDRLRLLHGYAQMIGVPHGLNHYSGDEREVIATVGGYTTVGHFEQFLHDEADERMYAAGQPRPSRTPAPTAVPPGLFDEEDRAILRRRLRLDVYGPDGERMPQATIDRVKRLQEVLGL